MIRWLVRCFLAGLFTILPLVITVAIVIWVAEYLNGWLGPETAIGGRLKSIGRNVGLEFEEGEKIAYAIGWVIVLGAVFGLGVLIESGARRWVQGLLDGVLGRLPMLGGIYGTVRQLVGMVDKQSSPDLQGMSVVYCVFGAESGAAFLALLATPEKFQLGDIEYHAIIIPSAPVPVGGSLLFVPVKSVQPAGITVDAFMSVYVSMGVTGPQLLKGPTP